MQIRTDLGTMQGQPDAKRLAFQPVAPITATNIEDAINQVQGNISPKGGTVTLTANAASTVVTNAAVVPTSRISMSPITPDAGNDGATTSWVAGTGQFTITHANNARVDRTFNYWIFN
jgi:hypothetical protein